MCLIDDHRLPVNVLEDLPVLAHHLVRRQQHVELEPARGCPRGLALVAAAALVPELMIADDLSVRCTAIVQHHILQDSHCVRVSCD